MGPATASIYALLMIFAYYGQISKLIRTRNSDGLSLQHFTLAWIAVAIRISTVGMLIYETKSATAIALAVAEVVVFFGLLAIIALTWRYRRLQRRAS
ncbi:MAG: DUF202 domain-containing protein [Patescibacteria group bacterium]